MFSGFGFMVKSSWILELDVMYCFFRLQKQGEQPGQKPKSLIEALRPKLQVSYSFCFCFFFSESIVLLKIRRRELYFLFIYHYIDF